MPGRQSRWQADHAGCQEAVDTLKREKDGEIERLKASLVRQHTTRSGTPWQTCRVCDASAAQVHVIAHAADCPLLED